MIAPNWDRLPARVEPGNTKGHALFADHGRARDLLHYIGGRREPVRMGQAHRRPGPRAGEPRLHPSARLRPRRGRFRAESGAPSRTLEDIGESRCALSRSPASNRRRKILWRSDGARPRRASAHVEALRCATTIRNAVGAALRLSDGELDGFHRECDHHVAWFGPQLPCGGGGDSGCAVCACRPDAQRRQSRRPESPAPSISIPWEI